MNQIEFTFSDMLAGYITEFSPHKGSVGTFSLKTPDDKLFEVTLTANTYAELMRNLGEPYHDCTSQMTSFLVPNRYVFVYGVFYPETHQNKFEAKHIVFAGRTEKEYLFEKPDWWTKQIRSLANFYLNAQFEDGDIDFRKYRTGIGLVGAKEGSNRQETDTISRLVYGFATAYMLTGEDRYLEAAEKGTEYLREHMRFLDDSEGIVYWYHAINVKPDGSEQKIFSSEFGDDYDAIPAYEQIYALAGPTQTYRVTGDPRIMKDVELTVNLFDRYFLDRSEHGGFFSHIDPISFSPYSETLGHNRARKNWNSVGDHAPAYLINLWLATGKEEYANFLESTFDTIEKHFPDDEHSPFVQERFYEDWSHDTTWGWQQNRAVVGHNLKIAWNLMRMNHLKPKEKYVALAKKIAEVMPKVGSDLQRGGWYDVVERTLGADEKFHRCVWHDRKAWWQQEQAILAYLILAGSLERPEFLKLARESSAFYNAWFLDYEAGGIYFNVLANGLPYLLGTERSKGSHSMSGYHSFELAYLSTVYTNLLLTQQPMDLYFKPKPGGFENNILRVQPDILPPDSVHIGQVWINGQPHYDFDPNKLTVKLPLSQESLKVRVRIIPIKVFFDAACLEVTSDTAKISLKGLLDASGIEILERELQAATTKPIKHLVLLLQDLECITSAGLRSLVFIKQKLGSEVEMQIVGARENVKNFLMTSSFYQEITLLDEEAIAPTQVEMASV
jgi:anti-anti-sigma factor